jgi:5-oxoprolinase (ATP-hydrolysing)
MITITTSFDEIAHIAGDDWKEGEVLVSNHPEAGGSHLPDITVITPVSVFHDRCSLFESLSNLILDDNGHLIDQVFKDGRPVFYVANRGHHADIGGITPGSMPPFSKTLLEEGACIKSFKLVKDGIFQEEGLYTFSLEISFCNEMKPIFLNGCIS